MSFYLPIFYRSKREENRGAGNPPHIYTPWRFRSRSALCVGPTTAPLDDSYQHTNFFFFVLLSVHDLASDRNRVFFFLLSSASVFDVYLANYKRIFWVGMETGIFFAPPTIGEFGNTGNTGIMGIWELGLGLGLGLGGAVRKAAGMGLLLHG